MRLSMTWLSAAVLLAGCSASVDVAQQRDALTNLDRDWGAHANDVDKFVAHYAGDASVYAPGAPLVTGAGPIRDAIAQMLSAPGTALHFEPTKADVSKSGDLGYTAGTYEMKMASGTEKGKYVTVWARQADGAWKAKEDIFNADAEVTPATQHVVAAATALKWGAAPPVLPKGASLAVVAGDPSKAGPYVVRLRMPAGYRIMPHWHPTDENVTVLDGTGAIGMGDRFDAAKLQNLGTGAFTVLPATMHHYFMAKTAATVQIHGMGPFALTYVNPADAPGAAH